MDVETLIKSKDGFGVCSVRNQCNRNFGVLTFLSQAFYKAVYLTREILNLNLDTLIQSKDDIFIMFNFGSN